MAGIEVATGELVRDKADSKGKFIFNFVCPDCGNNLVMKDRYGYFCAYPNACYWGMSHEDFERTYGQTTK